MENKNEIKKQILQEKYKGCESYICISCPEDGGGGGTCVLQLILL